MPGIFKLLKHTEAGVIFNAVTSWVSKEITNWNTGNP